MDWRTEKIKQLKGALRYAEEAGLTLGDLCDVDTRKFYECYLEGFVAPAESNSILYMCMKNLLPWVKDEINKLYEDK